jgi:hypothetical protein
MYKKTEREIFNKKKWSNMNDEAAYKEIIRALKELWP